MIKEVNAMDFYLLFYLKNRFIKRGMEKSNGKKLRILNRYAGVPQNMAELFPVPVRGNKRINRMLFVFLFSTSGSLGRQGC